MPECALVQDCPSITVSSQLFCIFHFSCYRCSFDYATYRANTEQRLQYSHTSNIRCLVVSLSKWLNNLQRYVWVWLVCRIQITCRNRRHSDAWRLVPTLESSLFSTLTAYRLTCGLDSAAGNDSSSGGARQRAASKHYGIQYNVKHSGSYNSSVDDKTIEILTCPGIPTEYRLTALQSTSAIIYAYSVVLTTRPVVLCHVGHGY